MGASTPAARSSEVRLTEIKKLQEPIRSEIQPVQDASFHFRLEPGVDCTGTFVSNTGHFLTALHCISACLIRKGAIERELAHEEPTREVALRKHFTYKMRVDEGALKDGVICPGRVHDARVRARVVATGKGWLAPKSTLASFSLKYSEDYRKILDQGYEHAGDFALLRIEDWKSSSCLPLAGAAPSDGDSVRAISFPCLNRNGVVANGRTPFFTQGLRTSGFKKSEFFTRHPATASAPFDFASVERPETFFSSLDIEKCGSGTGVVNKDFHLAGIATRVYKNSTHFERGSLESLDIAHVQKELKEKLSGSEFKEATACPKTPQKTQRVGREVGG